MFGAVVRAAGTVALGALLIAIMDDILADLIPMVGASNTSHWLVNALQSVQQNAVAVAVLSALVMLIAAAVEQQQPG